MGVGSCGCLLGSIPNGADLMVEWSSFPPESYLANGSRG